MTMQALLMEGNKVNLIRILHALIFNSWLEILFDIDYLLCVDEGCGVYSSTVSTFFLRNSEPESTVITSLDAAFTENETDEIALASDSDGYLSEVLDWIPFPFYQSPHKFYAIASPMILYSMSRIQVAHTWWRVKRRKH